MVELQESLFRYSPDLDTSNSPKELGVQQLSQGAKKCYRSKFYCSYCEQLINKFRHIEYNLHFCNRDCKAEWQKIHIRGRNHPMYGRKNPSGRINILNYLQKKREYYQIKNIFESWTPESLWVLGMLVSDGWLQSNRGYKIGFCGDFSDMQKIKKLFDAKYKIQNTPSRCYKITICNKQIYDFMVSLGITENKSLTIQYPNIPKDYESTRHFIRGEFDGDGTIALNRAFDKRRNHYREKLVSGFCSGSFNFMKSIKYLLRQYGINTSSVMNGTRCFYIHIHHYNSLKLFDFMYKNVPSSIYNERKHNKFLEVIEKTKYVKCLNCNNKIIRNLDDRLCGVCQKTSIHYLYNRKYITRGMMKRKK